MRLGMCLGMRSGMCSGMCLDMCSDMCLDMCLDTCPGLCRCDRVRLQGREDRDSERGFPSQHLAEDP